MAKSRYESHKPIYQTTKSHSQPPMGSVAVFEWETFSPLTDFSDKSLTEVFTRISRDIIERPYHYDSHKAFDTQGKMIPYPFTSANNLTPPDKIPGVAVYKQNHGTGHALRQSVYTGALIDKIAVDGNSEGRDIAQTINANSEIKSILKLAAYCKRIGRTLDYESDPGHTTIYSKRSSDMFAQMATELGYKKELIQIIRDGMLEPTPKDQATLDSYKEVAGIKGKELRYFTENILMSAHMADLTRIHAVKRNYIESSLRDYFDPIQLKEVATGLVEIGCKANELTGNKVAQQEDGVKHTPKSHVDGKKLVEVVTHIDQTFDALSKFKLTPPTVEIVANPQVDSKTKNVFVFDIDDTLIQQHTLKARGGPIFDKNEISKIQATMAEAINKAHEVWIVSANWAYDKEHIKKLFRPDPYHLFEKIKFYNGVDIGQELDIPRHKLVDIHIQGKKAEFLAKKIAKDPALNDGAVHCVLFDDTQSQIDNCAAHSTDKIKIEGYRVDDYKALQKLRAQPAQRLSEAFAEIVSKAPAVSAKKAPNQAIAVQPNPQVVAPIQQNFKKIAHDLYSRFKIGEKFWFFTDGDNIKASFKDAHAAQNFRDLLTANGIMGGSGKAKKVQTDHQYHVIYLTKEQFNKIDLLKIDPMVKERRHHFFNNHVICLNNLILENMKCQPPF